MVAGTVEIELPDADATAPLETDESIRPDPEEIRRIHNRGDERAKLVVVGAPL